MRHPLLLFLLLGLGILSHQLRAQSFPGLLPDGYAGVLSVDFQPAAMAASGLKLDILISGVSSTFGNDYLGMKRGLFFGKGWKDLNEENYPEYLKERLNGREKFLAEDLSVHLPSVMLALNARQSLAFTARVRSLVNFDGVGEPAARFAYYLLDLPEQFGQRYDNAGFRAQALSYLELGLAFSQVIRDKGPHFMKIGGRVKWIEGMAGFYLSGEQLAYTFHNDSVVSIYDARFQYAHSQGFEEANGSRPWSQLFKGNHGLGLDLGYVYEYRPEASDRGLSASPYRFHLGFSLLDMGSVGFRQSAGSQDFSGTVENYDLSLLKADGITDFDSILKANFEYGSGAVSFRMRLPTAVSLQLDYRLSERFFLGFIPYWPVKQPSSPNQTHGMTTYTLLPRYEAKGFGLGLPFSIQDNGRFTAGITLRAGPVVIGSRNLLSLLASPYSEEADVHFALRVPIPVKHEGDMDEDGVPDNKDRCPEVAGLPELRGCPEPPQYEPMEPAELMEVTVTPVKAAPLLTLAENPEITFPQKRRHGLPASFQPPQVAREGLLLGASAPHFVVKPLPFSPAALIALRQPWPEEPEPSKDPLEAYLPYADNDEDGIPNREDKCPDIPGEVTNDGCPEAESGYFQEDAFQSLYFDTNESELREKSRESLGLVIAYLRENPDAGVRLAGHTDNSGAERYNIDLSLDRCLAARLFLRQNGIEADRIRMFQYGESRPAASNDSPEGRQLNRRVDITLVGF